MRHTGAGVVNRVLNLLGKPALVGGGYVRVLHALGGIGALAIGLERHGVKVACVYLVLSSANILEVGNQRFKFAEDSDSATLGR
jgi:hypothetical protein